MQLQFLNVVLSFFTVYVHAHSVTYLAVYTVPPPPPPQVECGYPSQAHVFLLTSEMVGTAASLGWGVWHGVCECTRAETNTCTPIQVLVLSTSQSDSLNSSHPQLGVRLPTAFHPDPSSSMERFAYMM